VDEPARQDGRRVGGVVAIVRLRHHEATDELLDALVAGGVDAVEVTLPTPGSLESIRRWAARGGLAVGAGTVRTPEDVDAAADAGAQFLVTPTTVPAVLEAAARHSLPVVCGALTPSEVDRAWQLGAAAVKVFPVATVGGPAYVRAIGEPLDDVPLLPTGGVDVDTTAAYAAAGCVGVGVGGRLVSEELVAARDWAALRERAAAFAAAWAQGGPR
jgi:2-dehydro-3-deoxyphosphogluconate aldolase/(4S)-4-hydroxy-2-oxoglutarate aldolase